MDERVVCWSGAVQTEFRPTRTWSRWTPDRASLRAFVEFCERRWPEPASFTFEVARPERVDRAQSADEARRLMDADMVLAAATGLDMRVHGQRESLDYISSHWSGNFAS